MEMDKTIIIVNLAQLLKTIVIVHQYAGIVAWMMGTSHLNVKRRIPTTSTVPTPSTTIVSVKSVDCVDIHVIDASVWKKMHRDAQLDGVHHQDIVEVVQVRIASSSNGHREQGQVTSFEGCSISLLGRTWKIHNRPGVLFVYYLP
jgi:hypothetical protein